VAACAVRAFLRLAQIAARATIFRSPSPDGWARGGAGAPRRVPTLAITKILAGRALSGCPSCVQPYEPI
jgi:hypothetical protein